MTPGEKKFPALSVFFRRIRDAPSLPGLIGKTFAVLKRRVEDYEGIVRLLGR